MRLYLIPISSRRTLIYGQRLNRITDSKPSLADKVSERAAKVWLSWENGKSGWQRSITDAGNKLFNRIPYEEWGLKSIPPLSARRKHGGVGSAKIEVVYPPSIIQEERIPIIIQQLATKRNDVHRKRLAWSLVGIPIVAPFALVPLIPNIPFFYLLYRAFSHWKALAGAKHLKFLVSKKLLEPSASKTLDAVYRRNLEVGHVEKLEEVLHDPGEVMLIKSSDAKDIATAIDVPELAVECERACTQVEKALQGTSRENLKAKYKDLGTKSEKNR